MWVSGVNAWSYTGYSVGTNGLGMCFNISNTGATTVDYRLITPLLYTTTLRASNATVITLEDDATITGSFNSSKPWSATTGNITLSDTTGNYIYWSTAGLSAPTFGTRSTGTKLVLYPSIGTAGCDYAIGIDNSVLWFSTPTTTQTHRLYCGITRVLDISNTSIIAPGKIYNSQTTQTTSLTPGTTALTIAHLINGIYQITQTVAVTLTLPTGTLTYNGGFGIDQSLDWTVINTGTTAGATTVGANTAHTIVGSGLVAIGTSGRFRKRISALNTAITYRLS